MARNKHWILTALLAATDIAVIGFFCKLVAQRIGKGK